MYPRILLNSIKNRLDKREILILYGARQVGKTTLLKMLAEEPSEWLILNCELPVVSNVLESKNLSSFKALFGMCRYIGLDEAQKIMDIGSILKLIYDELPEFKIIATGSSSFDLANRIVEPLTGRNVKYSLFPLSLKEIQEKNSWLWNLSNLNQFLIFGTYPGIIDLPANDRQIMLSELSGDYLFKDILVYDQVKHPAVIRKLLKAIALQVGSQVSVNELSNLLGISRQTVEKYLDLLEKSFVIFSLESFSSNLRNEMKKSRKYYFHDNGIMNALTGNFTPVENRKDIGLLWENFCMSERVKINGYSMQKSNMYFWRTYDGAEIDLVEEKGGKLIAFEFKWKQKRKISIPAGFAERYNVNEMKIITSENLHDLIKD
jgi:hypothetical protein